MYKLIRRDPSVLSIPNRTGYRSSSKMFVSVPFPKNERFKRTIRYIGPTTWNSLPQSLRMINDYNSYKKTLKKYMYNQYCRDGFV